MFYLYIPATDSSTSDGTNLAIVIAVPIVACVVVAILTFLLGVFIHRVFTRHCKKRPQQQPLEPIYDDIILNTTAVSTLPHYSASHNATGEIITTDNEAYDTARHVSTGHEEIIVTNPNEAYECTHTLLQ